jgi:hypothetical protein
MTARKVVADTAGRARLRVFSSWSHSVVQHRGADAARCSMSAGAPVQDGGRKVRERASTSTFLCAFSCTTSRSLVV